MEARLIRTLSVGCRGLDVSGVKRTVYRALDSIDGGKRLAKHASDPVRVQRTFGPFFLLDVRRLEKKNELVVDGRVTPPQFEKWEARGYPDALARSQIREYEHLHTLRLCYPQPEGPGVFLGQGLHQTGGVPGNWAMDFMAPGGTPVLASFDCVVERLSGHDPATGTHGSNGDVFGWSVYVRDAIGRLGYLTHLGSRSVFVGKKLRVGEQIGTVGRWPRDPGRSHLHEGISSPRGSADARARITEIANAEKLPPL